MGIFSPKVKVEQLERLFSQLQEQIVENGKLRTQLQLEIENKNQLSDEFSKQSWEIIGLKNELNTQEEKLKQYSEHYTNLMSQYKKIKAYTAHLEVQIHEYEEKVKNMISTDDFISMDDFIDESVETEKYGKNGNDLKTKSESKCFKCTPIIYRKTSLETWIAKLEHYITSKKENKKHLQEAISKLENCKKGLEGENLLKRNLFELGKNNANFKDMIILHDVCFKSPFETKNIQIDFIAITNFVIFIFDSKYRTGVEKIDINNKISHNMLEYRNDIMEILSRSGLQEKFKIKDGNIYAIMVYSGKNEIAESWDDITRSIQRI